MNHKTWTVILREYLAVVKRKSFLIMTILGPLGMAGIMALQIWLSQKDSKQDFDVVDRARINMHLQLQREAQVPSLEKVITGQVRPYTFHDLPDTEEAFKEAIARVNKGERDAVIIIPADMATGGVVEYHAKRITDFQVQSFIRDALTQIATSDRLKAAGLSGSQIAEASKRVPLKPIDVSGRKDSAAGRSAFGFITIFALYMMIAIYGGMIMNGFIEDKSSKVMEVMLSCVSARQILLGKVLGVALTSLTQLGVWALAVLVAIKIKPDLMPAGFTVTPFLLLMTVVFFLLGYLGYALMMAAAGAMCTTLQDAQQYMLPIYLPIIIAMTMMPAVIRAPDGGIALALSLCPLTAPIIMPAMLGMSSVPLWQLLTSIGLLLLWAYLVLRGASKLFRMMILNQGKAPTLKQGLMLLKVNDN